MVIGSATVTENSRKRLWKIHQDPVNRKQEPTQLDWVWIWCVYGERHQRPLEKWRSSEIRNETPFEIWNAWPNKYKNKNSKTKKKQKLMEEKSYVGLWNERVKVEEEVEMLLK